jgi:hypothetical protein
MVSWKLSASPNEKSGGKAANRGNAQNHEKGRPVIAFYPNAQNPTARQSHPTARLKTLIKKHLFLIKKM